MKRRLQVERQNIRKRRAIYFTFVLSFISFHFFLSLIIAVVVAAVVVVFSNLIRSEILPLLFLNLLFKWRRAEIHQIGAGRFKWPR